MIKNDSKQTATADGKSRNMKNIYIQKLSKIMRISRENLLEAEEQNHRDELQEESKIKKRPTSNLDLLNNHDKLEKNRESARKARKRKKLYVKLLEKQVERLKEIAAEGKKIQSDTSQFMSNLRSHIAEKKQLFNLKPVLMNNMFNVSSCTNISEQSISPLLQSYQTKIGPICKQRIQSLDIYTKDITQNYLPMHIQKIFGTSEENFIKQIKSENKKVEDTSTKLTITQIYGRLKTEQGQLENTFLKLRNTVSQAKEELKMLSRLIDQMKREFSAMEVCRFLLFIQNQKGKKEVVQQFIQHLDQIKFDSIKDNAEQLHEFIFKEQLRKMIYINSRDSEQLLRRISVYIDRDIQ